jgi:5'-nucleotidase (lipoprotein e(P4) family)
VTRARIGLWVAAILISGCASAPPREPAAPAATASPASSALPNDLKWARDSAEYHAAVLQAYRAATARVEREAAGRARGTWAVSLDADETVISNLRYQIERGSQGMGFTSESWNAWVRRREATPLPGAAAFLARVRALGGRIAIVTNRLGSECPDTEAVFRTHALVYDVMLCRPDGTPSDKNPRFAAVASGRAFGSTAPLDVVAFVGDNILDFPGLSQAVRREGDDAFADFGVRFFLVPNPMYGSWQ